MSLFKRFSSEAEFRDTFVKPLLNRLGFYGVAEMHGTQEFGKDFVFSELHRLGGLRHYAAQVKHVEKIIQGKSVDTLLAQVRQAFTTSFRRSDSPRECHVSAVYIFNSGGITANAKDQLLDDLGLERYGDNVHFLDGERLHALNEWVTLQDDARVRARLIGLRATLHVIMRELQKEDGTDKDSPFPLHVRGLELFLAEPVAVSTKTLQDLYKLWNEVAAISRVRDAVFLHRKNHSDALATLSIAATNSRADAEKLLHVVNETLAKLEPII